jgi:hypothetical protein
MRSKIILIALGAALAVGAAFHISHEPPKDGICPLGKVIHGK